ncbi:Uncharacterised protein [Mycobacteroides abscessus subsp. abscessus]|nr:Uncharacterised protein [Mycobacteroides abscessus subsp. abscessus]
MIQTMNSTAFFEFLTNLCENFFITRNNNFRQFNAANGLWPINALNLNHVIRFDHFHIYTAIQ